VALKLGRLVWVCVFALGAVALVGCQEVVESTTYRFIVTESLQVVAPPIQGVEICQAGNRVTTDETGNAEIKVPFNQEVTFTVEKEGYGSYIFGDVSDVSRGTGWRLYPDDQLEDIAEQLQTRYPWGGGGGMVGLAVAGLPDFAGVTFIPVGSPSDAVGEPFYYDADAMPREYSLDLEATTGVSGAGDGGGSPYQEGQAARSGAPTENVPQPHLHGRARLQGQRVRGDFEPIVSDEIFEQVQSALHEEDPTEVEQKA
jgi:hypothetical protein